LKNPADVSLCLAQTTQDWPLGKTLGFGGIEKNKILVMQFKAFMATKFNDFFSG